MIDSLDDKEIIELFNQDGDKSNLAFKHIVNQFGGTLFLIKYAEYRVAKN